MAAGSTWSSIDPGLPAGALSRPVQRHLDAGQLFELLGRFGRHGALPGGGITRLAAGEADAAARREFLGLPQSAGAVTGVDPVGNLFGNFELAGPDAPWILCGSHLGQPARRRRARRHLWRAGGAVHGAGAGAGAAGRHALPGNARAYLELHIEQGPVLDAACERIGVVTRNWDVSKHRLVCVGAQAHTGPTPMAEGRDVLVAASRVVVALRELADTLSRPGAPLHTAVGRLLIEPNSPNTVPARSELRSPDADTLARADATLQEIADDAARLGQTARAMDTVAGHDALNLVDRCDVGLVFVPSIRGISHHPDERTASADLALGLRVLADVRWTACQQPPPARRARQLLRAFEDAASATHLPLPTSHHAPHVLSCP